MDERRKPPTRWTMFLPPSHPFWKMTDEEFAYHAGDDVARVVVKPIPLGDEQ